MAKIMIQSLNEAIPVLSLKPQSLIFTTSDSEAPIDLYPRLLSVLNFFYMQEKAYLWLSPKSKEFDQLKKLTPDAEKFLAQYQTSHCQCQYVTADDLMSPIHRIKEIY